jgi:hypothetical protein
MGELVRERPGVVANDVEQLLDLRDPPRAVATPPIAS